MPGAPIFRHTWAAALAATEHLEDDAEEWAEQGTQLHSRLPGTHLEQMARLPANVVIVFGRSGYPRRKILTAAVPLRVNVHMNRRLANRSTATHIPDRATSRQSYVFWLHLQVDSTGNPGETAWIAPGVSLEYIGFGLSNGVRAESERIPHGNSDSEWIPLGCVTEASTERTAPSWVIKFSNSARLARLRCRLFSWEWKDIWQMLRSSVWPGELTCCILLGQPWKHKPIGQEIGPAAIWTVESLLVSFLLTRIKGVHVREVTRTMKPPDTGCPRQAASEPVYSYMRQSQGQMETPGVASPRQCQRVIGLNNDEGGHGLLPRLLASLPLALCGIVLERPLAVVWQDAGVELPSRDAHFKSI
ncbi:hypothetical protein NMY22_g11847 [Coprinellus aureogranulatus]|nr:hypothetical protein NMY22_g11847 [Coprinellus aureogranulatus]